MNNNGSKSTTIAVLDMDELAIRLMEVAIGAHRPSDEERSARQILADTESTWPADAGPFPFRQMAAVSLTYFRECLQNGRRLS